MINNNRTMIRVLPFIGLVVILLISGCIAWPFGGPVEQEQAPTLVLNNTANENRTFTVWVVDGEVQPDVITIYKRNGEVDGASPGEGLYTAEFSRDSGYVTSVEPPENRSRLLGEYMLAPGETHRQSVENFTVGSTIVVSLKINNRVAELNTANCDELSLAGLEVTARPNPPGGAFASYGCR